MRGRCLCGEIEFEVDGPLPRLYQCHCSLCRKQGGTASNTGLIVAKDKFRWLRGEGHISSWVKDTGFRSHFCSRCGSTVPNPLRNLPWQWVPAGLLEGGAGLQVAAQIYLDSRAPWDPLPVGGRHHAEMPEFGEFIAFLHGKPSC